MVHADKRGGSLIVDRTLPVIGRVKFACGSTVPAIRNRWDRMVRELSEMGRFDLLREVRDSRKRRAVIFDHWQRKALDSLPSGASADALIPTMRKWATTHEVGDERREQLKYDINHIERAASRGAVVADLPAVLESLRGEMAGTKRAFNQVRSTALVFARIACKRSSAVWLGVNAVERFSQKGARKRKGNPFTLAELRETFPNPLTDPLDGHAWAMATTGMGQKEYWSMWSVKKDRITIGGTKRSGRRRDVPLVIRPAVPSMHRRTFENRMRARAPGHVAYDLRRTYAHILEEAGIPRSRRIGYMGHGTKDVQDLYERHEVDAYLAADAEKIRAYLGTPEAVGLRLEGSNK